MGDVRAALDLRVQRHDEEVTEDTDHEQVDEDPPGLRRGEELGDRAGGAGSPQTGTGNHDDRRSRDPIPSPEALHT